LTGAPGIGKTRLAIQVARGAPRMRLLTHEQLLERVSDGLRLLTRGSRTAPAPAQ
jgi:predicted ATPase